MEVLKKQLASEKDKSENFEQKLLEVSESEKDLLGDVKNLTEQKELVEDENMVNY